MTKTTPNLRSKLTSAVAAIAVATTFTFSFPQQSHAFQGFFGFSSDACESRVANSMAPSFVGGAGPGFVYVTFAAIMAYSFIVKDIAQDVCRESDAEKVSDNAIQLAWAHCVNALASSSDKGLLELHRAGTIDKTTDGSNIWPYKKSAKRKRVRRNYAADRVLDRATGGRARFTGSTSHPTKVLNDNEIEAMLRRCNVPAN